MIKTLTQRMTFGTGLKEQTAALFTCTYCAQQETRAAGSVGLCRSRARRFTALDQTSPAPGGPRHGSGTTTGSHGHFH